MRNLILPIIITFILIGCKSKSGIGSQQESMPETCRNTSIDYNQYSYTFPSDVLFVLGLEFESIKNKTNNKYKSEFVTNLQKAKDSISLADYMEARLLELYPEKIYQGMITESINSLYNQTICDFSKEEKLQYHIEPKPIEQEASFHEFQSTEDESFFMQMTEYEKQKYIVLLDLGNAEKFADIADFNTLKTNDSISNKTLNDEDFVLSLEDNLLLPYLFFVNKGVHLYYRVVQSRNRAIAEAAKYYGDEISCGKKGDAFKHIFVNTLLKSYLSEKMAYLIMDVFWENQGNNSPCDTYMDLHNNHVGRVSQYPLLKRGKHWKEWSQHVYSFVENETKNAIFKTWDKTQVEFIIVEEKKNSDRNKYIYRNKESDCF